MSVYPSRAKARVTNLAPGSAELKVGATVLPAGCAAG
jgi:hypothetical protein